LGKEKRAITRGEGEKPARLSTGGRKEPTRGDYHFGGGEVEKGRRKKWQGCIFKEGLKEGSCLRVKKLLQKGRTSGGGAGPRTSQQKRVEGKTEGKNREGRGADLGKRGRR